MKFSLVLSALATAGGAASASICSSHKYTYQGCQYTVDCATKGTGYNNYVYTNVSSFKSCMQQCLTGEFGCDAVNYNLKKKTCTLLLDLTGSGPAKGVDFGNKTVSLACKNEG